MRGVTGVVTLIFTLTLVLWIYSGHMTLFQGQVVLYAQENDQSLMGKEDDKVDQNFMLETSEELLEPLHSESKTTLPVFIQTRNTVSKKHVPINTVSEMPADTTLSTTTSTLQELSAPSSSPPMKSVRHESLQREATVTIQEKTNTYSGMEGNITTGITKKVDVDHVTTGTSRKTTFSTVTHSTFNNSKQSVHGVNQTFVPEFTGNPINSTLSQEVRNSSQNIVVQFNSTTSGVHLNVSTSMNSGENLAVDKNGTGAILNTSMVTGSKIFENTKSNLQLTTFPLAIPSCPDRIFTDNKTRIVLYTKKRSGSSFTLDILRNHPDTFTMFEPIRLVLPKRYTFMDNVSTEFMMHNVLQCDFHTNVSKSLIPMDRYHKEPFGPVPQPPSWVENSFWGRLCNAAKAALQGSSTSRANSYRTPTLVEEGCQHQKHLAVKVIRFTKLESLHCALMAGVKIIYLVRDLRGIINSRISLDKKEHQAHTSEEDYIWEIEKYCRELDSDMNYLNRMNGSMPDVLKKNLLLLRYEDLAVNPRNMTQLVYDFLGIDLHENVVKFINDNTHVDQTKSRSSYSTARNSAEVAQSWKSKLEMKYIQHIQRICGDNLKLFGYRHVLNDTSLHSDLVGEIQDRVLKRLSITS